MLLLGENGLLKCRLCLMGEEESGVIRVFCAPVLESMPVLKLITDWWFKPFLSLKITAFNL